MTYTHSSLSSFSFNTRVITSTQGGMGKSLFVEEKARLLHQILQLKPSSRRTNDRQNVLVTIRVQGVRVDIVEVVARLNSFENKTGRPTLYHFDVAPTVCKAFSLSVQLIIASLCSHPIIVSVLRPSVLSQLSIFPLFYSNNSLSMQRTLDITIHCS